MTKFNNLQEKIIKEEFARAIMINKAKSVLSEAGFSEFISELNDYEQNMVLNESESSELIYEGLFQRLTNLAKGAIRKIAPDNREALQKLITDLETSFGTSEAYKKMGYDASSAAEQAEIQSLLQQIAEINPQIAKTTAQAYGVPFGGGNQQQPGGQDDAPENPSGNVKRDTQNLVNDLESPKAKGILGSIFDSYKFAFKANASMWEKIYGFINNLGNKSPAQQEKGLEDVQNKLEDEVKNDKGGDDKSGEDKPKTNKVKKVRKDVLTALNTVLDRFDDEQRGIDMSRKDSSALVKKLADNIVDQLRANGVKFKGLDESVHKAVSKRLLKEDEELAKARQAAAEKKAAAEKAGVNSSLETQVRLRLKRLRAGNNGMPFIKMLEKTKRAFIERGYGTDEGFKAAINSEVEQEFVALYDAYIDVRAMMKYEDELNNLVKYKDKEPKKKPIKDKLEQIKKVNKIDIEQAEKILKLSKTNLTGIKIKDKPVQERNLNSLHMMFVNFYRIGNSRNKKPQEASETARFLKLKKKGGIEKAGSKEAKAQYDAKKVPDAQLPQGKKGQINIKNLIFQAFKGLNLDKELMKDLEARLNKKLQGIAKQYISKGMEVNVLEEKLTRYANSVAKQLNERR